VQGEPYFGGLLAKKKRKPGAKTPADGQVAWGRTRMGTREEGTWLKALVLSLHLGPRRGAKS